MLNILEKPRRKFETEGLIEPDANPLTDDEDSDSETAISQQWPAWESVILNPKIQYIHFQTSEAESKIDDLDASSKWLRNCLIAVSPSMEFVAMAEVQNLILLERSSKNPNQMEVAASIKLEVNNI